MIKNKNTLKRLTGYVTPPGLINKTESTRVQTKPVTSLYEQDTYQEDFLNGPTGYTRNIKTIKLPSLVNPQDTIIKRDTTYSYPDSKGDRTAYPKGTKQYNYISNLFKMKGK